MPSGLLDTLRVVNQPSSTPRRHGPLAAALLVVVCVVGVGAWWIRRAAEQRHLTERLEPYTGLALPDADTPVDGDLAALGADIFEAHCSACHAVTGPMKIGPNLSGVTQRRDVAWIQAMILHPDSMTANDPVAAALKKEHGGVQMIPVGTVGATDARAIIEFFRRVDAQSGG